MINDINTKKTNRTALLLVIAALILAFIFMCLPAYNFDVIIYSQKSLNTTIGDANYSAALAEVQKEQKRLEAEGYTSTINETLYERTKKSGEVSSTVTFTLNSTVQKSMLAFLGTGLASSYVLLAIILFMILSIACLAAGLIGSSDELWSRLNGKAKTFRTMAVALLLVACLLVPVFYMTNTYALSREVYLYGANLIDQAGSAEFYQKIDYLLFDGTAGNNITDFISGMKFSSTLWGWLTLPCVFAMLIGAMQIRHGNIKHALLKLLLYAFIIVICVLTLYPYYVMLVTGFRSSAETNDMYFLHIFPTKWIFQNIKSIIDRGVLGYLKNSLLIAGGATVIALICGIPAAYSLARMRYKGRKAFLGFVIMSQMFSPVVLLIGISQLMSTLNLNDSIIGLMLINAAFNQAFAIWLLRGTFISISPEMEQAGRIDGCTTLGSLWHILLPMAAPGIVTTLIFIFINAWNEYTISTVLISTATNRPITVGITQFSSFNMIEWQYLFAASLLATIPVVILFMCIEKHLADGLTSGGVKG